MIENKKKEMSKTDLYLLRFVYRTYKKICFRVLGFIILQYCL